MVFFRRKISFKRQKGFEISRGFHARRMERQHGDQCESPLSSFFLGSSVRKSAARHRPCGQTTFRSSRATCVRKAAQLSRPGRDPAPIRNEIVDEDLNRQRLVRSGKFQITPSNARHLHLTGSIIPHLHPMSGLSFFVIAHAVIGFLISLPTVLLLERKCKSGQMQWRFQPMASREK